MTKPGKLVVWVLTREINEYDQDGEYFVTVFEGQPNLETLAKFFSGVSIPDVNGPMDAVNFLEHLRKGGGRRDKESEWYHLRKVTCE